MANAFALHANTHGYYHGRGPQRGEFRTPMEARSAMDETRWYLERRNSTFLTSTDAEMLLSLGFKALGLNPTAPSPTGLLPWIGDNGLFTNEFINQSGEDCIVVIWGPDGSWVTNQQTQTQITISLPSNGKHVISFPKGWSGAWAPVYHDTKLVNGQIFDTWGEGTINPPYSVVDVSREVNMNGRPMVIVGPSCNTDMNTCVFKCPDGQQSCMTGYQLHNCNTQPGANSGTDRHGAAAGGCGGMGEEAALKTYLG